MTNKTGREKKNRENRQREILECIGRGRETLYKLQRVGKRTRRGKTRNRKYGVGVVLVVVVRNSNERVVNWPWVGRTRSYWDEMARIKWDKLGCVKGSDIKKSTDH